MNQSGDTLFIWWYACARRVRMKLADFMAMHRIAPHHLRRLLGVRSRTTVQRYLRGERIPHPEMMARIERLTRGAVTLTDFLDPRPPRCVRIIHDREGRTLEVFPWQQPAAEQDTAPGHDGQFSAPLERAIRILHPRVAPTRRGHLLLDGRISDARRIVAEANAVLRRRGGEPIPYPGVEPLL